MYRVATINFVTDRQTDRRTNDANMYHANSRSVRSLKSFSAWTRGEIQNIIEVTYQWLYRLAEADYFELRL